MQRLKKHYCQDSFSTLMGNYVSNKKGQRNSKGA